MEKIKPLEQRKSIVQIVKKEQDFIYVELGPIIDLEDYCSIFAYWFWCCKVVEIQGAQALDWRCILYYLVALVFDSLLSRVYLR